VVVDATDEGGVGLSAGNPREHQRGAKAKGYEPP